MLVSLCPVTAPDRLVVEITELWCGCAILMMLVLMCPVIAPDRLVVEITELWCHCAVLTMLVSTCPVLLCSQLLTAWWLRLLSCIDDACVTSFALFTVPEPLEFGKDYCAL